MSGFWQMSKYGVSGAAVGWGPGDRDNTSTVFCWKVWSRGWSLGSCAPRSYQYIPVFFMLPAISGMSKKRLPEGSVSKSVCFLHVPVNF